MKRFFNPVTLKRLRRFRAHRRAWRSFVVLAGLYVVSLFAEFFCNDKPLVVRFNGRYYFPVLKFYPDNVFTGSGLFTAPDYKALRGSAVFRSRPGNYMVFPLIPFGPREHIDPDSVRAVEELRVAISAEPAVASVNIRPDFTISQAYSSETFFGGADGAALRGRSLSDYWALPPELAEALVRRFRNEPAPELSVVCRRKDASGIVAQVSVPAYAVRAAPPATVRLTFRDRRAPASELNGILTFGAGFKPRRDPAGIWERLGARERGILKEAAESGVAEGAAVVFEVGGVPHKAVFSRSEVRFPHPPSPGHWLGIDDAGRDVLARLIYGFRTSMTFGIVLVAAALALGAVFGALQGYYGGRTDLVCQRLIEIWSALPFLYIMIMLGSVYGRSFGLLLVVYGMFNWIGVSYYVRAEFLKLRRQPFVEAARCLGVPARKIIFWHILPNAVAPMITLFPFLLVGAISSLAALDYLGFGLPPPTPSWGELLAQAQQVRWAWWLVVFPSAALFMVILLGVFIGDGVRDAFDPRQFTRLE